MSASKTVASIWALVSLPILPSRAPGPLSFDSGFEASDAESLAVVASSVVIATVPASAASIGSSLLTVNPHPLTESDNPTASSHVTPVLFISSLTSWETRSPAAQHADQISPRGVVPVKGDSVLR